MSKFGSRNHAFGSFGRIFQLSPPGKSTICSRQTSALKRRWFASSSSLGCAGSTSKASWHRSKTETKNRFKSKTSVDSSPFRPLANHQFPSISHNFRMKITILGGSLIFKHNWIHTTASRTSSSVANTKRKRNQLDTHRAAGKTWSWPVAFRFLRGFLC